MIPRFHYDSAILAQNMLSRRHARWLHHHQFLVAMLGLLLIVCIISGLVALVRMKSASPIDTARGDAGPKVLILGMDGGDWDIIDPLLAEGKMPNLQRLIDEGVSATPKTLNPTISPAIWTTVATGKLPEKHGIRNFITTSVDYETEYVSSDARHAKAAWNIFNDLGWKTGLFSWWATWPAEDINGYTVTDLAVLDSRGGIQPESLAKGMELLSLRTLGLDLVGISLSEALPVPTSIDDPVFFETAHSVLNRIDKLFGPNSLYAFDRERPDVLMQIYGGTDAAQHLFLKHHDASKFPYPVDPVLREKYKDFIREIYMNQDRLIGEYLKRSGSDTHIIVLSDHGVFIDPAAGYRFTQFNLLLAHLNLLTFLPDGEIDFKNTIAFECNNNTFDWQRRLCINVEGRYTDGIVRATDFERTRDLVVAKLKTVRRKNGDPFFLSVHTSGERNSDVSYDIPRDALDDEILLESTYHPVKEYLTLSVESGNHYSDPVGPDGFFVWKGPNIKPGVTVELDLVDILPNLLYALGQPIGRDMDGVWRPELFLKPTEPSYIETYETDFKQVPISHVESFEDNDSVNIDGLTITIRSTNEGQGTFDRICFLIPPSLGEAIDTVTLRANNEPLPFAATTYFEQLPQTTESPILLTNLTFHSGDKDAYRYNVPLDFQKESSLGLWTNVEAYFQMPTKGYLRIAARGTPANGIWPIIELHQNGMVQRVTINTSETALYSVPLDAGLVRLLYTNDAKNAREDRNVYIHRLSVIDAPVVMPAATPHLEHVNEDTCFINGQAGTVEAQFVIRPNVQYTQHPNGVGQDAIDFLNKTGQLKELIP